MVDVVDTCTQEGLVMSMQQWARYFESRPQERTLNVISLEFSHSKMDSLVQAPSVVGCEKVMLIILFWKTIDIHLTVSLGSFPCFGLGMGLAYIHTETEEGIPSRYDSWTGWRWGGPLS